jgi:glucoamylase
MRPSIWTALGLSATGLLASAVLLPGPIAAAAPASSAAGSSPASVPSGSAPGRPGTQAYLDSSRKDCFGTAQGTGSKVWFTVADGVLSDVYSPTIENSDNGTLQYIVTDGSSFADLQQRDMTYSVSSPDPSGMVCRVTSTDTRHSFQLVTDYVTDPARDSVVMQTRLRPLHGNWASVAGLKVYARWDATIDNTGGGGSSNAGANNATIARPTTALISADTHARTGPFAARVTGALVASKPFTAESSGFVGTPSDGLKQLDAHYRLVRAYRAATDGNVVQTAEISTTPGRPFSLALGFGPGAQAASRAALASATAPFRRTLAGYVNGWRRYDRTLRPPPASLPGLSPGAAARMRAMYWLSANVLKADEDKTYSGAFVASPTDPWGQSVPATTTHPGWTYREVFARDSYETFTGLLADGDTGSARAMVRFLFDRTQQPDGSFPRNSLINGAVAPDTFGLFEIDEDAYPVLMAWEGGFAGDVRFYRNHVRPAADFIVDHGPAYGVERWEEHPGYSPSTIAAEIAGLVAASHLAEAAGDRARAALYLATADHYQRDVKRWTVTSTGPYGDGRYFIRLSPKGHPNVAESYALGNGSLPKVDQRSVIDAGFLELTRLGELPATDPDVQASLKVADSVVGTQTASGPGWHRYGVKAKGSTDGYGDCYVPDPTSCSPTGAPWFPTATGSGHPWPLLDGERAEQDLQTGQTASAVQLLQTMENMTSGLGLVPEQAWEDPDLPASRYGSAPKTASIGFVNGKPAGSAGPLIWGQAQYLRLVTDLQAGTLADQPAITADRYVRHSVPAALQVSITSPRAGTTAAAHTVVTGTTAPGATVVISAGQPGRANATSVTRTVADAHGHFRATIHTPGGSTVITAAAAQGPRATGWAQVTVKSPS